jgi:nicotinamide mononucleotide transporter
MSLLGSTPWEITATLCAVVGVVLLARRNMLGWPLGMVWAAISAWLAWTEWQLVSDAILYASYIPLQAACWIWWWRSPSRNHATIHPRPWMAPKVWLWLATSATAAICTWAWAIQWLAQKYEWIPDPDLLWRDSASTVLNFFAQILQGARRMECWAVWAAVNLLGMHIYQVKDVPVYTAQYAFFLALGIYGWWAWRRVLSGQPGPASNVEA